MRRVIRSNNRVATTVVTLPDQFAIQAASLGFATNTFSPASAGVHSPGSSKKGPMGDPGFGVNRWAGRLPLGMQLQNFGGATAPVRQPSGPRVGLGAGVSGQPGLPSTGSTTGTSTSIGWMSLAPMQQTGMAGA